MPFALRSLRDVVLRDGVYAMVIDEFDPYCLLGI